MTAFVQPHAVLRQFQQIEQTIALQDTCQRLEVAVAADRHEFRDGQRQVEGLGHGGRREHGHAITWMRP